MITSILIVIAFGTFWLVHYIWPGGNPPTAYEVIPVVVFLVSAFFFIPSFACWYVGTVVFRNDNEATKADDV